MRILLADEVLADFTTPALQVVFEETGKRYRPGVEWQDVLALLTPAQREVVAARCSEPEFFVSVLPQRGVLAAIADMRRGASVFAVTADASRVQWLTEVAGFAPRQVLSGDVLARADVLVDVDVGRLGRWKAAHPQGTALLWQTQHVADASDASWLLPVCDWQVVRWFARGGRAAVRIAACV